MDNCIIFTKSSSQKVNGNRLFKKNFFGAEQLLQTAFYKTLFSCLTWSKQLKSSQTPIFSQTAVIIKHPQCKFH